MKKYLIHILVIVVMLSLAGCKKDDETKSKQLLTHKTVINQQEDEIITNTTYTNNTAHFKISFPNSLYGFKVKTEHDVNQQSIIVNSIITFGIDTKDINWPTFDSAAEIFKIQIYTTGEWEKYLQLPYHPPKIITATTDYIYTVIKRNSFPEDVHIKRGDIDRVIASFELLEGEEINPPQKVMSKGIPQGDG